MTDDTPEFEFTETFKPENYLPFYRDGTYDLSESDADELTNSQADAEHIAGLLDLSDEHHVLDLACGHGRVSNVLWRDGYDVHGLDASGELLQIARRETDSPPPYVRGDMRRLPYADGAFDAVYNIFNSFGYFSDDENEQIVAEISRVLDDGGRLVMEIVDRDYVVHNLAGSRMHKSDDVVVADSLEFNPETGRQVVDRVMLQDGERTEFRYFLRLYSVTEIERVLERNGLDVRTVYGDLRGTPYSLDSRSICLVAEPG